MKIARDKDGTLWLYRDNVNLERDEDHWRVVYSDGTDIIDAILEYNMLKLPAELFPEITWESEPLTGINLVMVPPQWSMIKKEELDRLYRIDWSYDGLKETIEAYEEIISQYRKLPWWKRIFKKL